MDKETVTKKIADAIGWSYRISEPDFYGNIEDAFMALVIINSLWGIQYKLWGDDNGDTCEIGFWDIEAGKPDQTWWASGELPAEAITNAIAQCPIVMGAEVGNPNGMKVDESAYEDWFCKKCGHMMSEPPKCAICDAHEER